MYTYTYITCTGTLTGNKLKFENEAKVTYCTYHMHDIGTASVVISAVARVCCSLQGPYKMEWNNTAWSNLPEVLLV